MAHTPMRMCVGCRKMRKKQELLRLVRTETGIAVDTEQKSLSRGTYICRSIDCIAAAKKKKALQRQFKENIPETVYKMLEESIGDAGCTAGREG